LRDFWERLGVIAQARRTCENSGYNLARITYDLVLAPDAAADWKTLSTPVRSGVKDAIERHLRHEPTKVSKSRIKRLRGVSQPQYRLRVGDIRVFYDVTETQVQILAIVTTEQAQAWLDEQGTREDAESGGFGGGEG
jgi:mRNA-degrading endonuclease RelE of RelBE toxin-antitoxin system